jgi:3-deoxy-D-manno-octulosonic-acid transferase
MRLLYCISIRFYSLAIFVASFFNEKAKKLRQGQKIVFENLPNYQDQSIWIHASSLGEFEQARPIIEAIKSENKNAKIHLTFFSPSGYEVRKNYDFADSVSYLPLDTTSNAKRFIAEINPKIAIFVKYDFWFNFINELDKKEVKIIFISAIFRENQYFFKSYGFWFRKQLKKIDMFFTQDENSTSLLKSIGIENIKTAGDTRFDRVLKISSNPKSFELIEQFSKNRKILVAGSSWPADEEIIAKYLNKNQADLKVIIAPHLVDKKHIDEIKTLFKSQNPICLTEIDINSNLNSNVLIIDKIGILMHLYQYADIAYIGGGFGVGIHNILEAAVFGLPVIFGPNFHKFKEAKELISLEAAFSIKNLQEFEKIMDFLSSESNLKNTSIISENYVKNSGGATNLIMSYIENEC